MLGKVLRLAVELRALDYLSGPLKQAAGAVEQLDAVAKRSKGLNELGDAMQSFGKQAVIAGGVAAAALAVPIRAYTQLEDAQTHASVAFMTKAGGDPLFAKITEQTVQLGNMLPGTTADFFELAAAMKEAGASSAAISGGGLEAAADLKVLLRSMPGDQVGRMVATFKNELGLADDELVPLIDLLQKATFGFGLDLTEFADTAKYFAPIASTIGESGLESANSLVTLAAAMAQAGIRGRTLGTTLRAVTLELPGLDAKVKKSADVAALLGGRGIHLRFFDLRGQFLGFENFIQQVQKLQSLTPAQRLNVLKQLFGDEAAPSLAILSEKGVEGWQAALAAMQKQASLQQRITTYLGTTGNKSEAAQGTLTNVFAMMGQSVGPELKGIADLGNSVFGSMADWVQEHQTFSAVVMNSVGIFAGLAVSIGSLSLGLGTLIKFLPVMRGGFIALRAVVTLATLPFVVFFQALWAGVAAVWALTVALLANPITWVVIGVVALAAAVYLLVGNWSGVAAFFGRVWNGIRSTFSAGIEWLRHINLFDAGANILRTIWEGMKSMAGKPVELIRSVAQKIRDHLPFSPAKVGPLRDLARVRIVETLAATVTPAPLTRAMRAVTATALAAALQPVAVAQVPFRGIATQVPVRAIAAQVSLARGGAVSQTPRARPATDGITLHYAPVVHVGAGAGPGVGPAVHAALAQHKEELQRLVVDTMEAHRQREERISQRRGRQ